LDRLFLVAGGRNLVLPENLDRLCLGRQSLTAWSVCPVLRAVHPVLLLPRLEAKAKVAFSRVQVWPVLRVVPPVLPLLRLEHLRIKAKVAFSRVQVWLVLRVVPPVLLLPRLEAKAKVAFSRVQVWLVLRVVPPVLPLLRLERLRTKAKVAFSRGLGLPVCGAGHPALPGNLNRPCLGWVLAPLLVLWVVRERNLDRDRLVLVLRLMRPRLQRLRCRLLIRLRLLRRPRHRLKKRRLRP
jgi:hypothetical protein